MPVEKAHIPFITLLKLFRKKPREVLTGCEDRTEESWVLKRRRRLERFVEGLPGLFKKLLIAPFLKQGGQSQSQHQPRVWSPDEFLSFGIPRVRVLVEPLG